MLIFVSFFLLDYYCVRQHYYLIELKLHIKMTSKFGMKTYSRHRVCQSNIQFDQLFNDKSNKPTAAKSKGTLHRWGMTSFTSVRNTHLNGRKEEILPDDESNKRRKVDVEADDPFSFDAEPDSRNVPSRTVSTAPAASAIPTVRTSAAPTTKTNKFFKSGSRSSLYKQRQLPSDDSKACDTIFTKPGSVVLAVNATCNESVLVEKSTLAHDVFSELLLSTGVATIAETPIDMCLSSFKDETELTSNVYPSYAIQPIQAPNVCSYSSPGSIMTHAYTFDQSCFSQQQQQPEEIVANQNIMFPQTMTVHQDHLGVGLPEPRICTTLEDRVGLVIKDSDLNVEEKLELAEKSLDASNNFEVSDSKDNQLNIEDIPAYVNKDTLPDVLTEDDIEEEMPLAFNKDQSDASSTVLMTKEAYSESPVDLKLNMEDSEESVPAIEESDSGNPQAGPSLPFRTLSALRQRRIFNSPKKIDKRALYKHRPWQVEDEAAPDEEIHASSSQTTLADEFDELVEEDFGKPEKPALTRVVTWPTRIGDEAITSVKCPKKLRELYAVVQNVKQAHQCHESGETQEFNDDIEYLLDGLQQTNGVGTRCLSILSLAAKCMAPSFRMHLRAHGTLTKVFSALQDAPKDNNLALCTATVMFILSQDRLNMDLERPSLELMLQLLETESDPSETLTISTSTNGHNREFDKNKEKVKELCDQLQKKGYAKQLDLDNITAGVLAMETLLSLTSRRAGEWFKEELRELGGLDHLVNTVSECGQCLPSVFVQLSEFALDKLKKLDRCLRVLENVTLMNLQNQSYLITCLESSLIVYCSRALKLCESCLKVYPSPDNSDRESPSWILYSCLLSIMKVLLNLTNENPQGSSKVGEQDGLICSSLSCVLELPSHLQPEQRFDLLVLSLGLLVNLVEYCEANRQKLFYTDVTDPNKSASNSRRWLSTVSAPKALVNLFMDHEEAARVEEAKTDNLLDGKGDGEGNSSGHEKQKLDNAITPQSSQEDIEETLKKVLQKAGKNMEDTMIAAYIALLLGCLIQDCRDNATKIRDHFPKKDFDIMVQVLKKFLNFMNLANVVGSTGMKSIQRVIDILEAT